MMWHVCKRIQFKKELMKNKMRNARKFKKIVFFFYTKDYKLENIASKILDKFLSLLFLYKSKKLVVCYTFRVIESELFSESFCESN